MAARDALRGLPPHHNPNSNPNPNPNPSPSPSPNPPSPNPEQVYRRLLEGAFDMYRGLVDQQTLATTDFLTNPQSLVKATPSHHPNPNPDLL